MNNFITLPLSAYVDLSLGRKALIDWRDLEWVQNYKWYFKPSRTTEGYAVRLKSINGKLLTIFMHREIFFMHNPETDISSKQIDHVNRQPLDNRLGNLRSATCSQNHANKSISRNNTSGFKGVSYHKKTNTWKAQISCNGTDKSLGYYSTPEEAAFVYNKACKELFGEFGYLNEIGDVTLQPKVRKTPKRHSKSGYPGIHWHKQKGKWMVNLNINGKKKYIGLFNQIEDAIAARDKAIKENNLDFLLNKR